MELNSNFFVVFCYTRSLISWENVDLLFCFEDLRFFLVYICIFDDWEKKTGRKRNMTHTGLYRFRKSTSQNTQHKGMLKSMGVYQGSSLHLLILSFVMKNKNSNTVKSSAKIDVF